MVTNLSAKPSVFNSFIAEIRDAVVQKDSMRFRRNLERIAEVIAYEVSKTFEFEKKEIQTPLGIAEMNVLSDQPVLATILRAGLAMHQGMLNYFDRSESAFISAFRKHITAEEFEVNVQYVSVPNFDDKVLIISDPMLATGSSMVTVYRELLRHGRPKRVIICVAIASKEALEYVQAEFPRVEIYAGAIDNELTAQAYIVPGLGDAGDLAFGKKF